MSSSTPDLASQMLALARQLPDSASVLRAQLASLAALPSAEERLRVCSARDDAGRGVLHYACTAGQSWAVESLLRAAGAPSGAAASAAFTAAHTLAAAQDGQGQSALHLALKGAADRRATTSRAAASAASSSSSSSSSAGELNGHLQCANMLLDVEEAWQRVTAAAAAAGSADSSSAAESDEQVTKRAKVEESSSKSETDGRSSSAHSSPSLLSLADSFLRTPLHWAVTSGSDALLLRVLSLLASSSPSSTAAPSSHAVGVNAQTRSGDTALHWACCDGRVGAVELLLSAGADGTLTNLRGEKPVDLCASEAIKSAMQTWMQRHASAGGASAASSSSGAAASDGAPGSDAAPLSLSSSSLLSSSKGVNVPLSSAAGKKKAVVIKLRK